MRSVAISPKQARTRSLLGSIAVDGAILCGSGLLIYGAWAWHWPAGVMVAGALLLAAGILGARQ